MDVLLLSAPPKSNEGFGINVLQMELTASWLGKKGYRTEILDGLSYGLTGRQLANFILRKEFSVLGCFMAQDTALSTLQIVRKLREAGWGGHACLLGGYAGRMYKTLLANDCGIDSVVVGRDELVLEELAQKTLSANPWENTSGLAYYHPQQGIVVNKGRRKEIAPKPTEPLQSQIILENTYKILP